MNAVLLESFARLQAMLDGQLAPSASTFEEPVFERLRSALAPPRSRSPLDLAVLIRHALAYENGCRGSDNDATLRIPVGNVIGQDRQNGSRSAWMLNVNRMGGMYVLLGGGPVGCPELIFTL